MTQQSNSHSTFVLIVPLLIKYIGIYQIETKRISYYLGAIPAETAGNGKDKCAINVVKAVQVNISNAYMKLQSMN